MQQTQQLNGIITDIHCHVIPGVDDGSKSLERSMGLIDMEYEEGIRRIIATPHWGVRNADYDAELAADNFAELKAAAEAKYPDLSMYMGNEIFVAPGYPIGLKDGMSLSLAGSSFALIEFPYESAFEEIIRGCRNVMEEGYVPIIAHVERYRECGNVKSVTELVNHGVLIQINADAIGEHAIGIFGGDPTAKYVQKLLKEGLVDFVATDCHDLPGRWPVMKQAVDVMIKLIGEQETARILVDNPNCVIENNYIR